jgi:beta-lactamase regulating signal transducer with metallopeptidase domain
VSALLVPTLFPTLLARLAAATLAFTLLAGLLVLTRARLRERVGAEAAYALWLLVPLGVALCAWPVHRVLVHAPLPAPAAAPFAALAVLPAGSTPGALPIAQYLLAAWLAGALASAWLFARRQRALARALGPLRRVDGAADACISARADLGPLLLGLVRPRIVLPLDYAERYTPAEQAAILAHERTHRRRGDLWWNALAALLRCLFWFHPLAAPAQRRFLADQELACDSAVLRLGRHAPRTYAEALMKTQLGPSLPLGCSMLAGSPIHERILNLQRQPAPRRVRLAATLVLLAMGAAGARLAWSASLEVVSAPPAADAGDAHAMLKVSTDLSIDGAAPRHDDTVTAGTLHLDGLRDGEGRACSADLMPRRLRGAHLGEVDLRMHLVCDGRPAGDPRLLTRLGQAATMAIGATVRQPDGSYLTTRGFRLTIRIDPA